MRSPLYTFSGHLSLSKLAALIFALFNVLDAFGAYSVTPEQAQAVNAILAALWVVFNRDAIDTNGEP